MKFFKLTLLSTFFVSSLFTANAFALDVKDSTEALIEKCNIIYQNNNIAKFHKGPEHKACLAKAMLTDNNYKDLVSSILTLEDSLFAEKNILLALQFAAEPQAKLIRSQSNVVRSLEKELQTKIEAFHTQILNDEKYTDIINKLK